MNGETTGALDPDVKQRNTKICTSWETVMKEFDSFPAPTLEFDNYGVNQTSWIFRGHKSATYSLAPKIEREASGKSMSWMSLESMILEEFRAQARMHLSPSEMPSDDRDKLTWLGLMQHYGIPTRLLDFTFSPYIALYFALRGRTDKERNLPVELWAINAQAVERAAVKTSWQAERGTGKPRSDRQRPRIVSTNPASFDHDHDILGKEQHRRADALSKVIEPTKSARYHFSNNGCVTYATPPVKNRRLSSQQGVFLLSGADTLSFEQSLFRMMKEKEDQWYRLFQIPSSLASDCERRLFQMNVHDLSLFPDMEGLAGFINQKIRLHWSPVCIE